MLKISYRQRVSNDDILIGLNVRPQLMKMIKERKCRYFGHIVRGERYKYQRLLLEGIVDGKRGARKTKEHLVQQHQGLDGNLTMLLRFERHKIAISGGPWSPKSLQLVDLEPMID